VRRVTLEMQDLRPPVVAAVAAVWQALELASAQAGHAAIRPKGGRDIVTSADIAVEDLLRELIGSATGLPVVGEERGGEAPADGSGYWLIDPICGTTNYASGTPLYAVNVALAEHGQITAAVVGDPSAGEVLVAEAGRGCRAVPAAGAARMLRTSRASQAVAVEAARSKGPRRARAAGFIADLINADRWDFRSLGSTQSLGYVAGGKLAAWAIFATDSAVHCAAGTLLVTEAGGVVTDLAGAPWTPQSDCCLAAADASLHGELLALLG
jgi:myo-inositol-1(or 4)-monophosphatase